MTTSRLFAHGLCAVLLAGAALGCGTTAPSTRTTLAASAVSDREVAAALAERRAASLERLHAYRLAEVYPTDDDAMPIGVFRDARGVRCPMSELVFQSGRADLVDAVVETNNRLRLAEVHDGPLLAWMQASGLTQEEIVRVQGVMELEFDYHPVNNNDTGNAPQQQLVRRGMPTPEQLEHLDRVVAARAMVTAKLDAVEAALAAATAKSLATATLRLTPAERERLVAEHRAAQRAIRTASAK